MAFVRCDCGHEKRDHRLRLTVVGQTAGACKVCLCDQYTRASEPESAANPDEDEALPGAPAARS